MIKTNYTMRGYVYKWADTVSNTKKKLNPDDVKQQILDTAQQPIPVYLDYPNRDDRDMLPDITRVVGYAKLSMDVIGIKCNIDIVQDTAWSRMLSEIYDGQPDSLSLALSVAAWVIADGREFVEDPFITAITIWTEPVYHKYIPKVICEE